MPITTKKRKAKGGKGKKRKGKKPVEEPIVELVGGRCCLYLGAKELQRFGLKTGDGLLDVFQSKLVSRKAILEEVEFMGKMSPFAALKKHVEAAVSVEYDGDAALFFEWDPDEAIKAECNFWFCVTQQCFAEHKSKVDECVQNASLSAEERRRAEEEAEAEAKRLEAEKAAMREAKRIQDAIDNIRKPIEAREWKDLGSLSELKLDKERLKKRMSALLRPAKSDASIAAQMRSDGVATDDAKDVCDDIVTEETSALKTQATVDQITADDMEAEDSAAVEFVTDADIMYAMDCCAPLCADKVTDEVESGLPKIDETELGGDLERVLVVDCGVQKGYPTANSATQTKIVASTEQSIQCDGTLMGATAPLYSDTEVMAFLHRVEGRMEEVISNNNVMDIGFDDFSVFKAKRGNDSVQSEQIREVQTYVDLEWSRGKRISHVQWVPERSTHMAAVSCVENVSFEERVERLNTSRISTILLWNLNDVLLRAQLILTAPADVLTFAFHPQKSGLVVGGLDTGQLALWRLPKDALKKASAHKVSDSGSVAVDGGTEDSHVPTIAPSMLSVIEKSHANAVADLIWLPQNIEIDTAKKHLSVLDLSSRPQSQKLDSEERFFSLAGDSKLLLWGVEGVQLTEKEQKMSGGENIKWAPLCEYSLEANAADEVGSGQPVFGSAMCWSAVVGQLAVATELGEVGLASIGQLLESDAKAKGHRLEERFEALLSAEQCTEVGDKLIGCEGVFHKQHSMAVKCTALCPHFADVFLTVADWCFCVWRLSDGGDALLFRSPKAPTYLTHGCWSQTRPSVIFTAKMDGTVDAWDLVDQTHAPVFANVPISAAPITKMVFSPMAASCDQQLAVSDENGNLRILQVPRSLAVPVKDEKRILENFYEREKTKRKFVKQREQRLAAQTSEDSAENQKHEDTEASEEVASDPPLDPLEAGFHSTLTALLKTI